MAIFNIRIGMVGLAGSRQFGNHWREPEWSCGCYRTRTLIHLRLWRTTRLGCPGSTGSRA